MTDPGPRPAVAGHGFDFVGRQDELAAVVAALSSRPAVAVIEGPAGIGKSRLVTEALAVLARDGVRTPTGLCHPLREPQPYGPVTDALRAAGPWLPPADAIGADAGALAPLLPDLADRLPPPPSARAMTGRTMANAVRALLAALAPVALAVEDLHWADPATRELLLLLARDLPADSALVLTYRAEDQPRGTPLLGVPYHRPAGTAGTELVLRPLGGEQVDALARSALGHRPPAALARLLLDRSGGLPLIVEEDLTTLVARGRAGESLTALATDTAAGHGLDVPRSLREVMHERLARLGPPAAALVDAAAVLAVPAGERLLGEVAGLSQEETRRALEEALGAAVLHELGPDSYGFAHALAVQAVHQAIPGPARTRAHRRALEVLQGVENPPLVRIAHHTKAVGDMDAWLPRAQAAADQAIERGDLGTAAGLLQEILDRPSLTPEQTAATALALANAIRHRTEPDPSTATLRRLLAIPGLPAGPRAELRLRLGLHLANWQDPAGLTEIEAAVPDLEQYDVELAARAMASLAGADHGPLTVTEQRGWLERARATLAGTPHRATEAGITMTWISLLGRQGDPRVPDLLAGLPREDEDPGVVRTTVMALANAAENGLLLGQDEQAVRWAEEGATLSARTGTPLFTLGCEACRLVLTWLGGRWEQWETDLDDLRGRYPDGGPLTHGWYVAVAEGRTALARGQFTTAAGHFDRLLAADPGHQDLAALAAAAGTARIHLARQDPGQAWQAVSDYLPLIEHKELWTGAWDLLPVAVEAALLRGDRAAAEDLSTRHAAAVRDADAPGAAAEQHFCRGLLLAEDPAAAAEAFEQARAGWTGVGRPHPAALAAERAATALTAAHPARAEELFADTATRFEAIGATADAARCRSRVRALGGRRSPTPGRAGYGDRLSPREEQVLDLLRHRATNRDIAAALSLSTRTVEHHVASVLRKTGTTREQLAEPDER
ncbi:ATP-binding protein [Kitasatospora sp. NPDC004240]